MPPRQAFRTPRRRRRPSRGGQQPRHNTIAALARLPTAQLLWANTGYSNKVTGNNERDNNTSPATGCDCIMTGQMPVCDAGAAQVCQGWQHQCYKGNNARVMRATMPALLRQQQCRGAGNDASMCCDCLMTGQTPGCNAGGEAKAMSETGAMTPARGGQRHQCNASGDTSATRASAPVQRGQGQAQFWAVSGLWSTPSDCCGLGWAGRWHKMPSGQQPFQHQPLLLNPSEQHVGCGNHRRGGWGHGGQEKARGKGHKRPQD